MTTWTQNGDTHTANVKGFILNVTKSEQFGSWGYSVSNDTRIRRAGDMKQLEAAKMQAEREAEGLS